MQYECFTLAEDRGIAHLTLNRPDAFFSIHEVNIGITADVGTLQRMPHLMPQGVVRELAYTGRRMPAAPNNTRTFSPLNRDCEL